MTDTLQYSNSKELLQPTFLKEWKGFTVTRQLAEGESIVDAAKGLIKEMEELHSLYLQSSETLTSTALQPTPNDKEADETTAKEIEDIKQKIQSAKSKQAAGQILFDSPYKHNKELKELVNSKTE